MTLPNWTEERMPMKHARRTEEASMAAGKESYASTSVSTYPSTTNLLSELSSHPNVEADYLALVDVAIDLGNSVIELKAKTEATIQRLRKEMLPPDFEQNREELHAWYKRQQQQTKQ